MPYFQYFKDKKQLSVRSSYRIHTFILFFKDFIYLFLERGEGKEKERGKKISVWLPLTCPLLGTWPATQACALTENRTSDPLVRRPALNSLSYTSQGWYLYFISQILWPLRSLEAVSNIAAYQISVGFAFVHTQPKYLLFALVYFGTESKLLSVRLRKKV